MSATPVEDAAAQVHEQLAGEAEVERRMLSAGLSIGRECARVVSASSSPGFAGEGAVSGGCSRLLRAWLRRGEDSGHKDGLAVTASGASSVSGVVVIVRMRSRYGATRSCRTPEGSGRSALHRDLGAGPVQYPGAEGMPLGGVGVQQPVRRRPPHRGGELPAEVRRVAHTQVEPSSDAHAGRRSGHEGDPAPPSPLVDQGHHGPLYQRCPGSRRRRRPETRVGDPPGRPHCTVPAPSGSQETTMDGRPPDNPRANSTKPQVTSTSDLGPKSGPPGIRTLNPPGKSRLLCAIELTARGEGGKRSCPSRVRTSVSASRARRPASWTNGHGLPVQDSNLGPRIQNPRCCRLHQPGTSRMPAGRTRCLLVPNQAGSPMPLASGNVRRRRRPLGAGPVPLPGLEPGASAFVVRRSFPMSYKGVSGRNRTTNGRRASNPLLRFGRPTCPPSSPRPQDAPWPGRSGEGGSRTLTARTGAPGLQPGGAATAPSSPCGSGGAWLPDPALVLAAGEATGTSLGNVLLRCAVVKGPENGQQGNAVAKIAGAINRVWRP